MGDNIKVLHLPVAFLPWTVGGREVYTYGLAYALQQQGVHNFIAFHQDPHVLEPLGDHEYHGLPVTVLPPIPGINNVAAKYTRVFRELPGFEEYLKQLKPDVVHFHDQNGGASLSHLRLAQKLGIKTVVTYHSPGQSCSQSELLFRGRTVCDGKLIVSRCTSCRLSIAGLPDPISDVLSHVPVSPDFLMERTDKISRLLGARMKTRHFIDSFYDFIDNVDIVHTHVGWVNELLRINKIDDSKIFFARTGATAKVLAPATKKYKHEEPLKLAFIGRCTQIKGISVLIDAIKLLPEAASVKVSFYGPYWDDNFGKQMIKRIQSDPRFDSPVLIPNDQLPEKLSEADAVVIPSTWLETGPLTVFDALCAGVPVIGSRLGGIAELIKDNVNGLLFDAGDAARLSEIIRRLISDREIINRLKLGIDAPRTMDHLAAQMIGLYRSIIGSETRIH